MRRDRADDQTLNRADRRYRGSVAASRGARRTRGRFRRRLTIFLLVLLAAAVVGGGLLWGRVTAFNDKVSTAPSVSSSLLFPLNGSDRVNVLMLGYSGASHDGTYLSDSINILSIDPKTNATTTIPIPRDLWIEGEPALPDNGKVNEVFAAGYLNNGVDEGGRAAAEVLSHVTGLKIDHWIAIDFVGFQEMVDAVGGVTIDNPRPFAYTTEEDFYNRGIFNSGSFKRGRLELDGARALAYTRARYTSDPAESSDFARSVRQARVLAALKGKLGAGGLGSIGPGLRLMSALEGRLRTDLSAVDLYLLSGHLGSDRRIELSEDQILQATTNTLGQYVLAVIGRATPSDYEPLKAYIRERLDEPIVRSASPSP
jgi:polyisoprenyl-teichoic acid--peptidoglycan teichoic acid transferase